MLTMYVGHQPSIPSRKSISKKEFPKKRVFPLVWVLQRNYAFLEGVRDKLILEVSDYYYVSLKRFQTLRNNMREKVLFSGIYRTLNIP